MLEFFTNPVLRAPTLTSMLMCFSSGLIGCLVFLQRRSLVGEALSHAAYPGVVISVAFASYLFPFSEKGAALSILLGAFITALLGLWVIDRMEKKLKISSDAALCFVLSIFFGVGVLIASRLQVTHALWFQQIQIFLFGQAATLVDAHIFLYGILACIILATIFFLFHFLRILNFDPDFAKTVGMPTFLIDGLVYLLLAVAIVVGMRSVGVVLMSAMLIAPAAAARQWTKHLGSFFTLSALFGMGAGFLGNAASVYLPLWVGQPHLSLATGPMIVLAALCICIVSFLFSPRRGVIVRMIRISRFRTTCLQENILKVLYKGGSLRGKKILLWWMGVKGLVKNNQLTEEGKIRAEKLIRLHRLWEVYLVHLGQGVERVHHNAEEMEHILTPEMEKELQYLLDHPEHDPHQQPIPKVRK